jgi:hypothetical protein
MAINLLSALHVWRESRRGGLIFGPYTRTPEAKYASGDSVDLAYDVFGWIVSPHRNYKRNRGFKNEMSRHVQRLQRSFGNKTDNDLSPDYVASEAHIKAQNEIAEYVFLGWLPSGTANPWTEHKSLAWQRAEPQE